MEFIILISWIAIVVGLFIGSGLLVLVTKLFKVKNPSYKKSLIVLITSIIASFITGIIFLMIHWILLVFVSVTTFFIFYFFYKKFYQSSWKKSLGIYVVFGIISLVISLFIIIFVYFYIASPFVVNGEAMSPTYNNGDYILINKFSKDFSRGDIVVFRYGKEYDAFFIKRIVGMPLEKVKIQTGKVFINGQVFSESYYSDEIINDTAVTLNQDQYFVLGDNRNAIDSRSFGTIYKTNIIGKVFYDF